MAIDGKCEQPPEEPDLIRGVDVSFLNQIEDYGGIYTEDGIAEDALQILKDHELNYICLRIWPTPSEGYNNLAKTLYMAGRIKERGFKFLRDFHYSDTWADPGEEIKPPAWSNLSFDAL